MKITLSFLVAVGFLILGVVGLIEASGLAFHTRAAAIGGPGTFPVSLLVIIIVLASCLAISELVKSYLAAKKSTEPLPPTTILSLLDIAEGKDLVRVLLMVGAILVYTFAIMPLGFLIATAVFILVVLVLFGCKRYKLYPILAVVYPLALYLLFEGILGIQLP
ncbi:MAG: tripartite tricarboxylate transporter TctB family protein [Oscillospiraceae bacterium]|nr:tripartite tricarboxylate transporter TctB family protein [Oscillospiraceae bacterium]